MFWKRIKIIADGSRLQGRIILTALAIIVCSSFPISAYFLYQEMENVATTVWSNMQWRAFKIENAVRGAGSVEDVSPTFWDGMNYPGEDITVTEDNQSYAIPGFERETELSSFESEMASSFISLLFKLNEGNLKKIKKNHDVEVYLSEGKLQGVFIHRFVHYETQRPVEVKLSRNVWPALSKPVDDYVNRVLIFLGWFTLIGFLGTWLILRLIFRPLGKAIDESFEEVKNNNYRTRVRVDPRFGREISRIIDKLNSVLDRMQEIVRDNINSMQDVSHEINTQLTAIKQSVDVIKLYGNGDKALVNQRLSAIEQSVERTKQIMLALLALAKLRQGSYEANPMEQPVRSLLEDFMAHQRRVFSTAVFNVQYESEDPKIYIDRDHFHLALNPIIENAVKYSFKDSKEVIVKVKEVGKETHVSVTNSGNQISPKEVPHLFERYYRGTNYSYKQGSGLGLHIAIEVVNLYKGARIDVVSEQGFNTFTLVFPRKK
ncbi:sensor histidine kinase [Cytobacillus oceanisediminis]|uniref:sensor histidine kinase n=1 Tax=Cytobacillus oceanisediminis TaxID=665099 RepID=UPI001FB5599D|nr:HAMP domain-containing sensor histidine kinase [Cytobacillus oceanisediminis]UOE58196.1 HAMP domain-containing histidine kinase [Cytobacillus oceanisediminis]